MSTNVAVQVKSEKTRFLLAVHRKATLQGRVVGQDGEPIYNADISISFEGWLPLAQFRTPLSGAFVFPNIPSNTYQISIQCGSYNFDIADTRHLPPGTEVQIEIRLPINGGNTQRDTDFQKLGPAHVSLDVVVNGSILPTTHDRGKEFVFPHVGQEYDVCVANRWSAPLLAVVTVDGLSVMNGEPGGFQSSGYIIKPFSEVLIPGWTLNNKHVAKFAFLRKEQSYAQLTHRPNDIGVIACAMFEKNTPPPPPAPRPNTSGDGYGWSPNVLESRWEPTLGTGFGRTTEHKVTEVTFERKPQPSVIKRIYYVGGPQQALSGAFDPNPFPGCKPPPGWVG
jgi:hypothetical protein